MHALFWFGLFGAIYSYFLYPVVLLVLPKRKPTASASDHGLPSMTLIITARNEQARIEGKLINSLAIDYPASRFEVIVASDESSDRTDEIVRGYADHGVKLVRAEERRGKEHAQGLAISVAQGEILVFSDVATSIPPDALRRLAQAFRDPAVGAVSSEDRFVGRDGEIAGEGAYVRYEMWLRKLESRVNSLVGLSGSFFAARREVCRDWDIRVPSDFNTALNCRRLGYIAVSDPKIVGVYTNIADERREYQRKLRTVLRGIAAVHCRSEILNPLRYGLFAFQVWSHKVMRWAVPWFLMLLFISNLALVREHWLFAVALLGQLAFYGLVIGGLASATLRQRALFKVPFFFAQVNAAVAHATVAFLLGKRMTVWEPSVR